MAASTASSSRLPGFGATTLSCPNAPKIDYKDVRLLASFISERGKIVPRRISGVCTPCQRRLSEAIKQARNIALLPFATGLSRQ